MNERIVEVIKEGEIIRMPERQAIEEELFILRRIFEPERREITELPLSRSIPKEREAKPHSVLETWKAKKFSYKRNQVIKDLISNFHWEIIRARRIKGISRKQLAGAIGTSEEEIKTIEMGELPRDDFVLINKIENALRINLRKERKEDFTLTKLQEMKEEETEKEKLKSKGKVNKFSGNEIELVE